MIAPLLIGVVIGALWSRSMPCGVVLGAATLAYVLAGLLAALLAGGIAWVALLVFWFRYPTHL